MEYLVHLCRLAYLAETEQPTGADLGILLEIVLIFGTARPGC